MTDQSQARRRVGPPDRADASDRRLRRTWWLLAGSFFLLLLATVARLVAGPPEALDLFIGGLVVVTGLAAILHRDAVRALETGLRAEAESFARILSGLSRSVSPDAILGAIVEELGTSTMADHVVVVRRRPDARVLEATLVTRRSGVPASTTVLPIADLEEGAGDRPAERAGGALRRGTARGHVAGVDPSSQAGIAVGRIAAHVRSLYGLSNTIGAPLHADGELIGAIVLSRRTAADAWGSSAERLLSGAAEEASAALSRAYSHRAAETLASTDPLTGLPNRRYFDEYCALLARRRRADDRVGILMIDVDLFKAINDTHGHDVGDEVLRAVAGALASAVREADVPARYGGEEFVVLLRNPSPELAMDVGERIREAVAALDLRHLGVGPVSVSIGVAVASMPDHPVADLQREADRALYEAKRQGRDRVVAA